MNNKKGENDMSEENTVNKSSFCSRCTDYQKHDSLFGYCHKYKEQRKWDNQCIKNEKWFNEGED